MAQPRTARWRTEDHRHAVRSGDNDSPGQRKYLCARTPIRVYSVGLLGAKTEIPATTTELPRSGRVARRFSMRRSFVCVLALFLLSTALTCHPQQTDVRQFAAFGAFSYLSTPSLNLTQRGFDGDFGYNLRSWVSLGFDFSYNSGHSSLLPNDLNSATQAKLAPFLPLLPPGFILAVPYNSSTYTYEAGPQFNYRRLKKVTLFVRPAFGALHA